MACPHKPISMSWLAWWKMFRQLRRRGRGLGESGAFLLGTAHGQRAIVNAAVYYDDIDPHALEKGYIHLSGAAMNKLWDLCADKGLQVLADVHTHPRVAGQSRSDKDHPMIALPGHTAMIIPYFARSANCLSGIGLYRHLGGKRWMTLAPPRFCWLTVEFNHQKG